MGRKKKEEALVSCHQCHRSHAQSETVSCTYKNCTLKYGLECMEKKYNEKVEKKNFATWKCPRCCEYCSCPGCNKILPVKKELASLAAENVKLKQENEDLKEENVTLKQEIEDLVSKFAMSKQAEAKPTEVPSTHVDMEAIAKKERMRLEELLKSKGLTSGSYPRFTVAVKGQKVTIKFQIPPTCEIALLISNIVANLGVKVEERATGSDTALHACDSGVAWQLTLNRLVVKDSAQDKGSSESNDGDFCVLLFRSLSSADKPEMEFIKQGSFTAEELDALASVLKLAGPGQSRIADRRGETASTPSMDKSITSLEGMGVKIYGLKEPKIDDPKSEISWENIAGYTQQKRDIEDTILLAVQSPEVYDEIARGTRCKFETNRPLAVLFEGPPGTGKTTCAHVIANQACAPLLYVPLKMIMSKYFGESERLLGKVFTLANEIPDGAIIFLDEVDSFATSRDNEAHEATRRILSVILRQIDGFEQDKKVVVIAATNRKQDLDPDLLSRFDSMITFGLPDQQTRQEIVAHYAKHLAKTELAELAAATEEMSGRDIRGVCLQAERRWASKIIRGQAQKDEEGASLPPLQEYLDSAMERHQVLLDPKTRQ